MTVTDASTGAFVYTPSANATGQDSFTFKVNDGTVDSGIATVTVNVSPVNDAPVVSNAALFTVEDTQVSGTLQASDADGDVLSATIVTAPSKGTVTVTDASKGVFVYTPNTNATGQDSFTFKVNDGTVDSGIATMTINILPDVPLGNNVGGNTLTGSSGDDTLAPSNGEDVVVAGAGNDLVSADQSSRQAGLRATVYEGYFNDNFAFFDTAVESDPTGRFQNLFTKIDPVTPGKNFDNTYSVEWQGFFTSSAPGTYTFRTASDDASWLWIGEKSDTVENLEATRTAGNAIVSNPGQHPVVTKSGTIVLEENTTYPILIYFGEAGGGDQITVSFAVPGQGFSTDGSGFYSTITGNTAQNDIIFDTGDGNDTAKGGDGGDIFIGGAGNDTYDGGNGIDILSYREISSSVTVNLAAKTVSGSEIGTDSFSNIEVISGGAGNDTFLLGDESFSVGALDGDDVFIAPNGTFGPIDGGNGTDTLFLGNGAFDLTTQSSSIRNIEGIHLSDGNFAANLTLNKDFVLSATNGGGTNALTNGAPNSLRIDGDGNDSVTATDGWNNVDAVTISGNGYTVFEADNGAQIFVDDDIGINIG